MNISVMCNATQYDGNMSSIKFEQELSRICVNKSEEKTECDRTAQGINLSTPILMTAFGVFGNVLALLVLYSSRKEAQARRTVFFVMLSGLAWTDLLCQFTVSPIAIITYANNMTWMGGVPLCFYHGIMMVSFGLVMPLIVCCMSIERFLAIKFSYYYARHITRRKAQLTFLACWCFTAVFATLPFLHFGKYEHQFPGTWCFLKFHETDILQSIYAGLFSCFNILAIGIMIVCNVTVAATLCRMRQSRQLHSSPSIDRKLSISGIGSTTTSGTVIRGRRHSDMEAQMIWFLLLITVAFSVCWLPLNVHILVTQFTGHQNRVLDLKVIRMASCNQILDPWLYVIFRKNSLLRIIRRIKACWTTPKEPPRNGPVRAPPLRYIMGNKSFTCEGSTAIRSKVHKCGQSPTFCRHIIGEAEMLGKKNGYGIHSMDSLTKLMTICPNCDCGRTSIRVKPPKIDLTLGHSPSSSLADKDDLSVPPASANLETNNGGKRGSVLAYHNKLASVPLLQRLGRPCKLPLKIMDSFDTLVSNDSYATNNQSVDSRLKPSIVRGLGPRPNVLNPSTPTQNTFPELFEDTSVLLEEESLHEGPFSGKSLPPLASPEQSWDSSTHSESKNAMSAVSSFHIPSSAVTSGNGTSSVVQDSDEKKTPQTDSCQVPDAKTSLFTNNDPVDGDKIQLSDHQPHATHPQTTKTLVNGSSDLTEDPALCLLIPDSSLHDVSKLQSSPAKLSNGNIIKPTSVKEDALENCEKSALLVNGKANCLDLEKTFKEIKGTINSKSNVIENSKSPRVGMNRLISHHNGLNKHSNR